MTRSPRSTASIASVLVVSAAIAAVSSTTACGGSTPSDLYDPAGTSTFGSDPLHGECSRTSDCGSGQLCCGSFDDVHGWSRIECRASCEIDNPSGSRGVRFCEPSANDCDAGAKCTPSASLTGYSWCSASK